MATPQNSKPEPSKIIRPISKFAGALVGTAVVTGKRIIGSVKPTSTGKKPCRLPQKNHRSSTGKKPIRLLPKERKTQHPRKRRHAAEKRRLQTVKDQAVPRMV
jgi:hypothetical protein